MIRVLIGFISGLFSGMGIGGGAILMIFVSLFMNEKQLTAQGFNLLYFIPVALISGLVHIYKKQVDFKSLKIFIPLGIIGTAAGSFLAFVIPVRIIKTLWGIILLFLGTSEIIKFFRSLNKKNKRAKD